MKAELRREARSSGISPPLMGSFAIPGDLTGQGHPAIAIGQNSCEGAEGKLQVFLDGFAPGGALLPPALISGDPVQRDGFLPMFGYAVSGAGDLNGDGHLDLLVGSQHVVGEVFIVLGGDWNFGEAS